MHAAGRSFQICRLRSIRPAEGDLGNYPSLQHFQQRDELRGDNFDETDVLRPFRIEAGAAKTLIDPFLSDNTSWAKGGSGAQRDEIFG
jgi:hypothetical protein